MSKQDFMITAEKAIEKQFEKLEEGVSAEYRRAFVKARDHLRAMMSLPEFDVKKHLAEDVIKKQYYVHATITKHKVLGDYMVIAGDDTGVTQKFIIGSNGMFFWKF